MSSQRRQERKGVGKASSFNSFYQVDESNDGFGTKPKKDGTYAISKAKGFERNGIKLFVIDDGTNDAGKTETIEFLNKLTSDPEGKKLLAALRKRKIGQVLIFKDTGMTNQNSDLNFAAENEKLGKFVVFDTIENPSIESIRGESFTSTWQRRLTHELIHVAYNKRGKRSEKAVIRKTNKLKHVWGGEDDRDPKSH